MIQHALSPLPEPQAASAAPEVPPGRSISRQRRERRPRILLVAPELAHCSFLAREGRVPPCFKAGGLADVVALILDLFSDAGTDVHIALPYFRSLTGSLSPSQFPQVHFCQDREFFYRHSVYEGSSRSNLLAALAFQRDVIHYILPEVRPDLVHCHDWMTGLIPAAARASGIPSLFTIHNLHDELSTLECIEDRGIDSAAFWRHLYFLGYPGSYESVRATNPCSLLASGILAADRMNTVSGSFLDELSRGQHGASRPVMDSIMGKLAAGHASGILNAVSNSFSPAGDPDLTERYDADRHAAGKLANKLALQEALGLEADPQAPMLFWPSRLDPVQKGCRLLSEILYDVIHDYWALGLQVVFVADGPFQECFRNIADFHRLNHRIAVRGFNDSLSRRSYAASDFTLMPSLYEPCGLSQMVALRYGSLPIVNRTGGLRDTVRPLSEDCRQGNGFAFEVYDSRGLRWAIDQAMRFHLRPAAERGAVITRVMAEAAGSFRPEVMMRAYAALYESILPTPRGMVPPQAWSAPQAGGSVDDRRMTSSGCR